MAESKNATYEAIMSDLKARKFAPIYYLMGDEAYYIDQITDYIAEHVLTPEERDFNQTVLFGSDVNASQITDVAKRYPMMSEYQVVIVKEAQNIKNTDALAAYVEKPLASTILVVCHKNGTLDKRKTFASKIQKNGVLFESKKLGEKELPAFIERYLKQHTATIDTKSTQMIVEAIGADLSRLTSELDKLLIALPENDKNVTPQVVENQIGVSKDFNAFELKAALVNRDVYKANQIIQYFDENPKSGGPFKLVPLLFSYFQNLMMAYYAPNPKSQEDVAGWLELKNVWAAKEYMTGMRNYSGMKVMQIIGKLRETDAKMKGLDNPNTDQGDLMKELIFYILH